MVVYEYFIDGFEEIEALGPVDVLRRGGVDVRLVSLTGKKIVTSVNNVRIETDYLLSETNIEDAEMIIIPGGLPGTENLKKHDVFLAELKKYEKKKENIIAAICAAPTVLAQEGLLEGRTVTTYPGMEGQLTGANYSTAVVVNDGNLITSQGPGTALEFGLELLTVLKGKEKADEVRKRILA